MKIIIPESSKNYLNIHELTENYLIIGYIKDKPFCVIMEDSCGDFVAMGRASYYEGCLSDTCSTISEVILNVKELYPDITFEAYE